MPSPAEQSAERKALARRQAVTVLRLAEATAGYAAGQLGNGLSPGQARQAALDAATELEITAGALRRLALAGLSPRELAVQLAASGLSQQQVADRLGRSRRTVRGYLSSRRARLDGSAGDCALDDT